MTFIYNKICSLSIQIPPSKTKIDQFVIFLLLCLENFQFLFNRVQLFLYCIQYKNYSFILWVGFNMQFWSYTVSSGITTPSTGYPAGNYQISTHICYACSMIYCRLKCYSHFTFVSFPEA